MLAACQEDIQRHKPDTIGLCELQSSESLNNHMCWTQPVSFETIPMDKLYILIIIEELTILTLIPYAYYSIQAQPNRKTGVCETDTFVVTGGASNDLRICGLNSGQHGKWLGPRRTTRNRVESGFTTCTPS